MDEPEKLMKLKTERRLKYLGIGFGLTIFTIQRFAGNDYTHVLVMLYFMFLLPSVGMDRAMQERYFPYAQRLLSALRYFFVAMTLAVVAIYLYAMVSDFQQHSNLPDHSKPTHNLARILN